MLKHKVNRLLRHPGFNKGGGGGSTTSTVQQYSPEEAARRTQVMDEAQRIYKQTAPQMSAAGYPGAQPIGFSPETQQARQLARDYAQQVQGVGNTALTSLQSGLRAPVNAPDTGNLRTQTLGQILGYGQGGFFDTDRAIQSAINPLIEQYLDPGGVMSSIRTGSQQAGQYGGSRQGIAEGVAAGRFARSAGDIANQMAFSAGQKEADLQAQLAGQQINALQSMYGTDVNAAQQQFSTEAERNAKLTALAPQTMQAGMMPTNIYSGLGQQLETLAADREAYNAAARQWQLEAPWAPLENYAWIV